MANNRTAEGPNAIQGTVDANGGFNERARLISIGELLGAGQVLAAAAAITSWQGYLN